MKIRKQRTTDNGQRTPKPSLDLLKVKLTKCILCLCRCLAIAIIGALLSPYPNSAWALYGDTESAFGLDGRLSTTNALVDNYNFEPFFGDKSTDQFSHVIHTIAHRILLYCSKRFCLVAYYFYT